MKKILIFSGIISVSIICLNLAAFSGEPAPINLPSPQITGGKPLMEALKERSTSREFGKAPLSSQTISNLLWAAFGINRPETGKRTAPSARNRQETDIYLANENGIYLYDASGNTLVPVAAGDFRSKTGMQGFVAQAPINLIYVADLSKMGNMSKEDKAFYAACDSGFISQNVYLYCASEGLATVVRGSVNREELAGIMKLSHDHKITLSQTIGYPAATSPEK